MDHAQIGIDIIEIERIQAAVLRYGNRFLNRIYTQNELAICKNNINSLAARFAGKESAMKALDGGIDTFTWHEVEILSELNGKPKLILHGKALLKAQEMGLSILEISLSHSRNNAIALVIGLQN
jgi:holo-[acyl-carrier protein] synthase